MMASTATVIAAPEVLSLPKSKHVEWMSSVIEAIARTLHRARKLKSDTGEIHND
jgi:hypothetical protein